jgi:2'-5' RNA ligase
MTGTNEYSLWIVPPENISERLAEVISRLSQHYSTPYFEPHVTLLGDVMLPEAEVSLKTAQLASLIRPFRLQLTTVSYLSEYFRCLFINVKETEELIEANHKARTLFKREHDPKFRPHLSLMYGSFPLQTKEEIISEIGDEFQMAFEVKSIYVVLSSSNIAPESWRKLRQFPFQQDQHSGVNL